MAAAIGNQYAARARVWRQAIECAIEHFPSEPPYVDCSGLVAGMRRAAHAFVTKMMAEKDAAFFREFGDRIEGKPTTVIDAQADVKMEIAWNDGSEGADPIPSTPASD